MTFCSKCRKDMTGLAVAVIENRHFCPECGLAEIERMFPDDAPVWPWVISTIIAFCFGLLIGYSFVP